MFGVWGLSELSVDTVKRIFYSRLRNINSKHSHIWVRFGWRCTTKTRQNTDVNRIAPSCTCFSDAQDPNDPDELMNNFHFNIALRHVCANVLVHVQQTYSVFAHVCNDKFHLYGSATDFRYRINIYCRRDSYNNSNRKWTGVYAINKWHTTHTDNRW